MAVPPAEAAHEGPSFSEAKHYVQQQLLAMGVSSLPEHQLETYTREFLRLVSEREDSVTSRDTSTCSSSSTELIVVRTPGCSVAGSGLHSPGDTPRSAVFKSFPGGKENRVDLPASPTPHGFTPNSSDWSLCVDSHQSAARHGLTRKVLRRYNGGPQVVEVMPCPDTSNLSVGEAVGGATTNGVESSGCHRPRSSKSFIPPATSHPHTRGLRKADPVSRYHEYRELWERQQAPGEKNRSGLRWQIREHLLQKDGPAPLPAHTCQRPNDYVVPSSKKRQALRWEIRTQLARHTQ